MINGVPSHDDFGEALIQFNSYRLMKEVGEPAKHAYIERWATIIIVRVPWIDSCMRRNEEALEVGRLVDRAWKRRSARCSE